MSSKIKLPEDEEALFRKMKESYEMAEASAGSPQFEFWREKMQQNARSYYRKVRGNVQTEIEDAVKESRSKERLNCIYRNAAQGLKEIAQFARECDMIPQEEILKCEQLALEYERLLKNES